MTAVLNGLQEQDASALDRQKGNLPGPSAQKLAVLMCMDDHIDLLLLSDLESRSQFFPNAARRAADAIDTLLSSGVLLEATAIALIHHSTCDSSELERSVLDDIASLRASPLIPKDLEITGLIYDVRSHQLHPITSAASGSYDNQRALAR